MAFRIFRPLALALMLPAMAQAAYLEFGSPAYEALQTASKRSGNTGWVAGRLEKNLPLTELTAKEEAQSLMKNKRLEPQYIKALKDAFPPETVPVEDKYVVLDAELQKLSDKIALVGAKLDKFEKGMRDGLLSGRSRPSMIGSFSVNMIGIQNYHGPAGQNFALREGGGSGVWTEWTLGGDGYNLYWVMEFYDGYIDFTGAHLGMSFDNALLPNIEVTIAAEDVYPSMSLLVFSGGGDGFEDDFKDVQHLSGRKDLIKSSPGFGARGGQDIYLRRKGSGDWWPFSDTQLVFTQTYSYYWNYLNDLAGNFKLRGLPPFLFFERTDPAFTFVWSFKDQADLNSNPLYIAAENSSAQAFALTSQLSGGGTFFFEFATAEWQHSDAPKNFRDIAYLTTISKSIGKASVVLDYQHTGPDYFAGTAGEPSSNASTSLFVLNDPRTGKSSWGTVASNPSGASTNSEHMALGLTGDFGKGSLGITLGTNQQIQASGPWLRTRHMIGFPWSKVKDNDGGHGFDHFLTGFGYNNSAADVFYDHGQAYVMQIGGSNIASPYLDDKNREFIILSQNGVGDFNLRQDTVKYVNFADLRGDINFQSMFDLKKPALLKFVSRLRNTDESFSIPAYTDKSLLMQMASSATLNVEFPGKMQLVTAIGYEDWLSKASFRPIEYHTTWAFLQFWKDFPEFLSDFSIGPTFAYMKNEDSNFSQRNFTAWSFGIGASTSF